jgi:hypothetical protein
MILFLTLIPKYGRKSNKEVQQLYGKGNIIQFVKGAKLEWAGHVWKANNSIVDGT